LKVIIDTNLLEYAFVKPKEIEFRDLHQKANVWLRNILRKRDIIFLMSAYQAAEVMEVFRKIGATQKAKASLFKLIEEKFTIKPVYWETVKKAYILTQESNIHIYDYLVVLPFEKEVGEIFSIDKHLQHPHFQHIGKVINPIRGWVVTEGRKPIKISE